MRSKPLRTAVTYWPKTLWNAVRSWCGLVLHPPLLPNPRRSVTNVFGCGSAALLPSVKQPCVLLLVHRAAAVQTHSFALEPVSRQMSAGAQLLTDRHFTPAKK